MSPPRRPRLIACLTLAALAASCGDEAPAKAPAQPVEQPALGPYPPVDELAERPDLPDLFTSWDGKRKASSAEAFTTWRSAELRALFAHYIYGASPPAPASIEAAEVVAPTPLDDKITYREIALRFAPGAPPVHVALFAPTGAERPPVFVAPNKCGNQSLSPHPAVRASTSRLIQACGGSAEETRGKYASAFPLAMITGRGFALATYHESDAAPDDQAAVDEGIRPHFAPQVGDPLRWGAIATWSWTTSRVIDHLAPGGLVHPDKIAVMGHSRRGKAALWSAANDPRIRLVVAHQSGTAGAALHRSPVGESIKAINLFFPHWFDDVFPTFAGQELRTPVDQHQLIALLAPRPVLLTDGDDDDWADPPGARAAAEAASPAYQLLGGKGLVAGDDGKPRRDSDLVWTTRPGDHSVSEVDWQIFLDFASLHIAP